MPGIYGCFGCSKEEGSHLQRKFSEPWGKCEQTFFNGGIIGGHAFSKKSSLHISKEGIILAVDGEISIYHMAEKKRTVKQSGQCGQLPAKQEALRRYWGYNTSFDTMRQLTMAAKHYS